MNDYKRQLHPERPARHAGAGRGVGDKQADGEGSVGNEDRQEVQDLPPARYSPINLCLRGLSEAGKEKNFRLSRLGHVPFNIKTQPSRTNKTQFISLPF